ncbi:EAL domain-containing protein [Thalassotalea sp. M1531]|uniref:EAL domain-containing protein n=1 Tax=Thalassotalea algicola TaxID=2716224 RepID=A0A7Y0Q6P8_9GAMM|nr:GGDEF domain-containing phosphodiesterase [Thalassotalea algicola]NMP30200.1 EAL domain-containing protein [Thalassotalea algicola]
MTNDLAQFFAIQGSTQRYSHALQSIYEKLRAKHCFIGKFIDDNSVKTILHLVDGIASDNFVYDLAGTPCAEAKNSLSTCCYNSDVQECFPDDIALVDWGIDSYVAVTIRSFNDKPVGILVCLFDHPIDIADSDKAWFREVGYLIGAEFKYEISESEQRQLISQMSLGEELAKLCTLEWYPSKELLIGSDYAYAMFGVASSEPVSMGQLRGMVDERDIEKIEHYIKSLGTGTSDSINTTFKIHTPDNQEKYLNVLGVARKHELTDEVVVQLTVQDISEHERLNRDLVLSGIVFEHSSEAVMITDRNNQIILVNRALEELTGYGKSELYGREPSIFSSGKHEKSFYRNMWHCLENYGVWRGELYNKRKSGEIFPEELSLSVVKDEHGIVTNYVAVFRDITQWKETEKRLTFYANKESLTGLANRRAFIETLDKHVMFGERFQVPFTVLFIDVNRFKEINDIYGHELGDKLLVAVGRRLLNIINNDDFVCRYGGDEFTVVLPEYDIEASKKVAAKVQQALNTSFNIDKVSLDVGVSIGLAQYPESGVNATEILRNANHAMLRVKTAGSAKIGIHDTELQNLYLRKLALRDKLKVALEEQKLTVYYQPIICAETQKIEKFEALVRWFDDLFGFISPAEFIPMAEEFGLISTLGQFVLEQACADLKQMHELGYDHISVSINRSINEFRTDNDQVSLVKGAINNSGIPPQNVMIEITESVAMSSNKYVKEALSTLREAGIKIALDDFCTGFSSLSNLIEYPADTLKIDKSFVDKILTNNSHCLLIQTLVDLAGKLQMKVIAEGVEEQAQLERLHDYGCNLIQGYYFSPAVDKEHAIELLHKHS